MQEKIKRIEVNIYGRPLTLYLSLLAAFGVAGCFFLLLFQIRPSRSLAEQLSTLNDDPLVRGAAVLIFAFWILLWRWWLTWSEALKIHDSSYFTIQPVPFLANCGTLLATCIYVADNVVLGVYMIMKFAISMAGLALALLWIHCAADKLSFRRLVAVDFAAD